jgi:hypothetical protein
MTIQTLGAGGFGLSSDGTSWFTSITMEVFPKPGHTSRLEHQPKRESFSKLSPRLRDQLGGIATIGIY